MLMAKIRRSRKEEYVNYKNIEYLFSFKIPGYWKKSKMTIRPNSIENYYDKTGDKYCYIYAKEKINYEINATLRDFAAMGLSIFKLYEGFELKSMQLMEKKKDCFLLYEISFIYMRKKYVGYLSFHESEKTFYELGIIIPEGNKKDNDYNEIINSFEVMVEA